LRSTTGASASAARRLDKSQSLLPHYALGILFVLVHQATGLRQVLIAHGAKEAKANRLWRQGVAAGAIVTVAVTGGLLGARM